MKTTTVPTDYREAICSGLAFYRIADSNRSADRMNYGAMITAAEYASVITALGRAAGMGDVFAEATQRAIRGISPYLNRWQVVAQIAEAFALFQTAGWEDVRSATGPEAGRPSSHRHPLTERQIVTLHLILNEASRALPLGTTSGIGWGLRALVNELGIQAYATYLPAVSADLAR